MFTIEFDEDETLITILDETGEIEDIQVMLYDDYCHVRQWNEKHGMHEVVTLTAKMYFELMQAWNLPQGAYDIKKKSNEA